MKTGVLFLLLLSLISIVYSINFGDFNIEPPASPPFTTEAQFYYGNFPSTKVFYEPNHYLDNEDYIDVVETATNYVKNRITPYFRVVDVKETKYYNQVYVNMVEQDENIDIDGSAIQIRIDYTNGDIYEVSKTRTHYWPDYGFEERGEDYQKAEAILEFLNQNVFNGEYDLSNISYDGLDQDNYTLLFSNLPFTNDPLSIKKLFVVYGKKLEPVWEIKFQYNYKERTVRIIDKDGSILKSDVNEAVETTTSKTIPVITTTTKAPKAIPTSSTSTTSTKAIPTSSTSTKAIPTSSTSTTSTKAIPTSSTSTTSTKAIPTSSTSTTSTKAIPTSSTSTKAIPTSSTSTTSTKAIPTSSTSTTSTKTIPTSTKTIPTSSTSTTSTKTIPTSTKTIPTSTTTSTTSTKTIPTSTKTIPCKNVTVTVKETVTITVNGGPTSGNEPSNCAAKWGQCGGQGFNGPTCCQSGSTCHEINQWYSQCL